MSKTEAEKGNGGSIPEEAPVAAPGGPKGATGAPAATRGGGGTKNAPAAPTAAKEEAPAEEATPAVLPEVPEGYVRFQNTAEHPVEFTLRDGENRGRKQTVRPGAMCIVPREYADTVRNHAPQLRRVG